jgi:hypothetical protein
MAFYLLYTFDFTRTEHHVSHVTNVTLPLLNTEEVSIPDRTSRIEKSTKQDPESKGHIGHIGHKPLITLKSSRPCLSRRLQGKHGVGYGKPSPTFTTL